MSKDVSVYSSFFKAIFREASKSSSTFWVNGFNWSYYSNLFPELFIVASPQNGNIRVSCEIEGKLHHLYTPGQITEAYSHLRRVLNGESRLSFKDSANKPKRTNRSSVLKRILHEEFVGFDLFELLVSMEGVIAGYDSNEDLRMSFENFAYIVLHYLTEFNRNDADMLWLITVIKRNSKLFTSE